MSHEPILPTADEMVTAAIDGHVAARPSVAKHYASGKSIYRHLTTIYRAQAALAIRRLADEVKQRRLRLATGAPLRELAASEYGASMPNEPTSAIGTVSLLRSGAMPRGTIPAGTKFMKRSDPTAKPAPLEGAEYETIYASVLPAGLASVDLLVRSTRPGAHANTPYEGDFHANTIEIADRSALFDPLFEVVLALAAGGGGGPDDVTRRRHARAHASGQSGPTSNAILAAALEAPGVQHVATIDCPENGVSYVFPADQRWGTSYAFMAQVRQFVVDRAQGFGLAIDVGLVFQVYVIVEATVQLRDGSALADTTPITANILSAITSYFDDREVWHEWNRAALRGVIARADRRIFTCTSVTVKHKTGTTLSDSSAGRVDPSYPGIGHLALADNGIEITYQVPT